MVTLTIHLPGSAPVSHVLKEDNVTIGRMAGNTIVIQDSSVSLSHARISKKQGEYFLKDLNSTNGTQVNGQPVTEARLRDRDLVRFADVSGQFNSDESVPAPAALGIREAPLPSPAPTSAAATARPRRVDRSKMLSIAGGVLGGLAVLGVVSLLLWNLRREHVREIEVASARTASPAEPQKRKAAPQSPANMAPVPSNSVSAALPATDPPPTDNEIAHLIKALQDPDPAERRQAVAMLHSLGPSATTATPALHQALSDPDQEVRLWAALALINIKSYDKAIPPILVHELQDEKPMLRQLACVSLGLLPYEPSEKQAVVPALLIAANSDADEDVRKAATAALGVIDPEASKSGIGK